jgi:hypothetical protein
MKNITTKEANYNVFAIIMPHHKVLMSWEALLVFWTLGNDRMLIQKNQRPVGLIPVGLLISVPMLASNSN